MAPLGIPKRTPLALESAGKNIDCTVGSEGESLHRAHSFIKRSLISVPRASPFSHAVASPLPRLLGSEPHPLLSLNALSFSRKAF